MRGLTRVFPYLFLFMGSFLLLSCQSSTVDKTPGVPLEPLSPEIMKEDTDTFFQILEETHPDLYYRWSEEGYRTEKQALYENVRVPATRLQFQRMLAQFAGRIHDGHTKVRCEGGGSTQALPFTVTWIENQVVVDEVKEAGKHAGLEKGDRIIRFAGKPINEYLDTLLTYSSYEVYECARLRALRYALPFSTGYQVVTGEVTLPATMELLIKKADGREIAVTLAYAPPEKTGQGQNPAYRPEFESRMLESGKAAYLKWTGFNDKRTKEFEFKLFGTSPAKDQAYPPSFNDFLRGLFETMQTSGTSHLIIDVRENGGGNSSLSYTLTRYLTDRNIIEYPGFVKNSPLLNKQVAGLDLPGLKTYPLGARIPDKDIWGEGKEEEIRAFFAPVPLPRDLFRGKVIILTGYRTYSAAEQFCCLMRDNGLAILLGEPTGNGASGPIDVIPFELPRTKTKGGVSFAFRLRPDKNERLIKPDIPCSQTYRDFLADRDTVLERALQLVREEGEKKP